MYQNALLKAYKYGKKGGLAKGLGLGSLYCMLFCLWLLLIWYTSIVVHKETSNGGESFTTMLNVVISGLSLGLAASNISTFLRARAAAYPIFKMIERNIVAKTCAKTRQALSTIDGHIQFYNVCFSYPSHPNVFIFDRLNFDIPSGKVIALMSESGSGKSTVKNILYGKDDATLDEITYAAKLSEAITFINNLPN